MSAAGLEILFVYLGVGIAFLAGLVWAAGKGRRVEAPERLIAQEMLIAQDILIDADDPLAVTAWNSYKEPR